jgi:predicted DNA-binding protein
LAAPDNPLNDSNDQIIRRRNKVLSTKVSVDLHNRFNLLAEYLFERGLSESFTPSTLLREIIEHLLSEYREVLAADKIRSHYSTITESRVDQ